MDTKRWTNHIIITINILTERIKYIQNQGTVGASSHSSRAFVVRQKLDFSKIKYCLSEIYTRRVGLVKAESTVVVKIRAQCNILCLL